MARKTTKRTLKRKGKRATKGSADPLDKYVGTRIRARRLGVGWSQTKLGEAVGVTFQQVQKYENGTNRVGASNLFKASKALGVEVAYFYEGMPEGLWKPGARRSKGLADQLVSFSHDPLNSREGIELAHNYFRIADVKVRRRLFQFIKSLAASANPK